MPSDKPKTIPAAAVKEIWDTFASTILEVNAGLGREEVTKLLIYMDDSGVLPQEREFRREEVDALFDRIFGCTHQSLHELSQKTAPSLLALAWDRVLTATNTWAEYSRQGVEFPWEQTENLDELFRLVLQRRV